MIEQRGLARTQITGQDADRDRFFCSHEENLDWIYGNERIFLPTARRGWTLPSSSCMAARIAQTPPMQHQFRRAEFHEAQTSRRWGLVELVPPRFMPPRRVQTAGEG